jgi:RNA polymerase sigma-70 factor (ECF subfamily)
MTNVATAPLQPPSHRNRLDEPSDHVLLERFRRGQQDAATQIYLRYAERLRALARSRCGRDLARLVDADDIVQAVFGSFFRRVSQGHYDVPDGEELWKLFLVLGLNKIRAVGAFHRAAKRDVRLTCAGEGASALGVQVQEDATPSQFLQLAIHEALERLPPQHRQMVELRIQGHEVAEIAQKTGRSKRSVERVLQEARRVLADLLPSRA